MLPHDLPPWDTAYQQSHRRLTAGVFEAIVQELHTVLRLAQECNTAPSAVLFDSHTRQSTPVSGTWAGYDRAKRRRGSQGRRAVETLGHLLALLAPAANAQDWSRFCTVDAQG